MKLTPKVSKNEIKFVYLEKKLAPANDIRGALHLVDPMWIFSPRVWKELQRVAAHAPTKYQSNSAPGRGARASYRTMLPEISAPEVAFGAKFQIPVARQGEREMSAPRPYVTEPFRPLSSVNKW